MQQASFKDMFNDHHEGIGPGWFAGEVLQKEMTVFFEQFHACESLLPTVPRPRSV